MIVLLLFLYPLLSAGQLVGTDLTQAVPLTAAAALGALVFGTVQFGVTASIVIGSVPAVLIGSFLSSRAPDRYIRPIITFVIFASGLKYIGVATTALGWILCIVLLGAAVYWLARVQPWRTGWRPALAGAGAANGQVVSEPDGRGAGPPNGQAGAASGPAGPGNGQAAAPDGRAAAAPPGEPGSRPRAG